MSESHIDLVEEMNYNNYYESNVKGAAGFLKTVLKKRKPVFGLTLGSGLGSLADNIKNSIIVPYEEIPNFRKTKVQGHEGKLIIGDLEGVEIIGLKGRTHYYEVAHHLFNNGILRTVFPVHVLAELNVRNYFGTNAVGGLNFNYYAGDLMIIKNHINFIPNPLSGRHLEFTRVDDGQRISRF